MSTHQLEQIHINQINIFHNPNQLMLLGQIPITRMLIIQMLIMMILIIQKDIIKMHITLMHINQRHIIQMLINLIHINQTVISQILIIESLEFILLINQNQAKKVLKIINLVKFSQMNLDKLKQLFQQLLNINLELYKVPVQEEIQYLK